MKPAKPAAKTEKPVPVPGDRSPLPRRHQFIAMFRRINAMTRTILPARQAGRPPAQR